MSESFLFLSAVSCEVLLLRKGRAVAHARSARRHCQHTDRLPLAAGGPVVQKQVSAGGPKYEEVPGRILPITVRVKDESVPTLTCTNVLLYCLTADC